MICGQCCGYGEILTAIITVEKGKIVTQRLAWLPCPNGCVGGYEHCPSEDCGWPDPKLAFAGPVSRETPATD
jgi:hypothetical protein